MPAPLSLFTPEVLVGVSPPDAAVITDFYGRLDKAINAYSEGAEIPAHVIRPQEVMDGFVRVTDTIVPTDEPAWRDPKYSVEGLFKHVKWRALLDYMYPGGEAEKLVIQGGVQGHPDYLPPPPHDNIVIDIKSIGEGQWMRIRRQLGRWKDREQVKVYMAMTARTLGLLVYENRENLAVWVVPVHIGPSGE